MNSLSAGPGSGATFAAFAAVAAALSAACGAPPEPSPPSLPRPSVTGAETAVELTGPGPAPRGRTFDAAAANARCEGCHADIASEWRGSLHRMAHTDPMFQRQFEREPFPFCTACHAPEADPSAPVPGELSHLGVGCVTCHVVGERILAAEVPPAIRARAPVPHDVTRAPGFDGSLGCGACHEFTFPGAAHERAPLLMQSTMKEHAQSAYADRSCASCHMPVVAGRNEGAHRSHRFAASRDEALVRSAIRVEEGPFADDALVLTLHPGEVGHAFPTGDMLRRLTLEIDVIDAAGRSVEHEEHHFQRHFGFAREPYRAPRRVLVKDDRVGAGASPLVFRYTARERPIGGRLRYTLRYERVAEPSGGIDGQTVVDGSILLAEGSLPLAAPPP